jgi:hypothetical protein
MVLNKLTFWNFRPVFDQNLEVVVIKENEMYTLLKIFGKKLMCCLLGCMVACLFVPSSSREWSSDMV